jgi:multiple sugar transport system substrate-binding protein
MAGLVLSSTVALAEDIRLQFRFNDPQHKEMRMALDEFEAANPGVKVDLKRIAWKDARDQLIRESAVGQGPDVVHSAFVWVQEFAQSGALIPLEELVGYSPLEHGFEDFVANDLTYYNDKPYGIPWTADTWSMIYNTNVLKEAGIINKPSTWAEVLNTSRIIKEKTGKIGYSFIGGVPESAFMVNYYLWSNGSTIVDDDGKGGFKIGVTKEQLVEAMDYYKTYIDEGLVPKSVLSQSTAHDPSGLQPLLDDKQAMAIVPIAVIRGLVKGYKVAHPDKPMPLVTGISPGGSRKAVTHLGGRTLVVNSATKHPKEAWLLLKHMISPAIMKKYYVNQMPATKTGLAGVTFSEAEKGFAKQFADHTRSWGPYSRGPAPIGQIRNTLARSFAAAISGQKSSEAAAETILKEIARLMKKK